MDLYALAIIFIAEQVVAEFTHLVLGASPKYSIYFYSYRKTLSGTLFF